MQVGDRIGDYEVIGVLGRGGMGQVYRVRSLLSDREEAMKVIYPDLHERTDLAERFLREIKVHASLQHPNIAALHTALRHQDQIVMILELVEGMSLDERLRTGPLPVSSAIHYIDQVLSALAFAHARAVVHRDIKPANILITTGDVVKLTDFGIARGIKDHKLTQTGFALGSLPYMSPEQIRGGPVDARSDLYSLGITFYEAVTGKRPIRGDSEYSLMDAQLTQIPVPPCEVVDHVPVAISDVIMKALAKDPDSRFRSALEFQTALGDRQDRASWAATPPSDGISAEELARVESKLVRVLGPIARHLVKDASRRYSTISDLCLGLAAQIPEGPEKEAFLKVALREATTLSMPAPSEAVTASPAWSPELLKHLEQLLAPHLGPIAKVIVKRAAKAAATPEQLYAALALEIPSEADRKRFLSAIRP